MEAIWSSIYPLHLDLAFKVEEVDNIVYTLNRTYSQLLPTITPFEAYMSKKPSLTHMQPSDCKVFTHIPYQVHKIFDSKSQIGLFLGYFDESKGYCIWDPKRK